MKWASPAAIAGGLLACVFAARAVSGVPAAWAYRAGQALDIAGRYAEAAQRIDRGAVGADRTEALWRAGRSRLESWDALPAAERNGSRGDEQLRAAAVRFLEGRAIAPGSPWFTAMLGDVYDCREVVARSRRITDLSSLAIGAWALVGDDARIAVGLARAAIDRQPNSVEFRDQLVLLLHNYGLHDEALRAIEESARVVPDFGAHPDLEFESLPRDLVERFWRTSRSLGPGEAPLQPRERHLLSLGQLARRLGHLEEAEQDLRAALQAPGTTLFHAEDAFHLGLVLVDLGRFDEAGIMLARAEGEPVFGPGVAEARARIAEKRERWVDALDQYRELRRVRPRDVGLLLRFARAAQKAQAWDQAEEALRWAMLVQPRDPSPHRAMVELFLAKGERESARSELDQYIQSFGTTGEVAQLEQALAAPLDSARP